MRFTAARTLALAASTLCACLGAAPSLAAPQASTATQLFGEAQQICWRDHGKLWGVSLCGPILLVDYTDQAVLANQADVGGTLVREGSLFRGVLPDSVIIANTPTEWSGTRWTQIVGPVPDEAAKRHVLLAHELFHRIQPTLGLTRPEVGNGHLDTLDGRTLLQLEWRALAQAMRAQTLPGRQQAIADALAFRHERYRLFTAAAAEEAALEINEGIAEYTGVLLGLKTRRERVDYALRDLSAFVAAPSFVRSFAYATGPAYGLLLDQAAPAWHSQFRAGQRFDELLGAALKQPLSADSSIEQKAARYDADGSLRRSEVQRDIERQGRLAAYKAHLLDGPVMALPLNNSNTQFNPQTLVPLEGLGTIYPTMRLTDDWGSLEVDEGGALVRGAVKLATVSAVGADAAGTLGTGWRLQLNPGWRVIAGTRPGDLTVVRDDGAPR